MIPAFKPGDMIRIRSGPFNSFLGKIDGINQAKSLLKIAVKIFSNTRIVLKFSDVEKVSRPRWMTQNDPLFIVVCRGGIVVYCLERPSYSATRGNKLNLWLSHCQESLRLKDLVCNQSHWRMRFANGRCAHNFGISLAMVFLAQGLQPSQIVLPLLFLMVFTLSGAALHGYLVLRRM